MDYNYTNNHVAALLETIRLHVYYSNYSVKKQT